MAVNKCRDFPGEWKYEVRINRGKENEIYKKVRHFKTQADAKKAEKEYLKLIEGRTFTNTKMTLEEAIDFYIEFVLAGKKESTSYSRKRYINKHILCTSKTSEFKPVFSLDQKIANIKSNELDLWRTNIVSMNMSNSHKNRIIALLKDILDNANVRCPIDPVYKLILIPLKKKDNKNEVAYWDFEEFKKFESVIDDKNWLLLFQTLYYTGLRIGELQALTFNDLLPNKHLRVNKQGTYASEKKGFVITSPKNKNSYRKIELHDLLYDDLIKYKEECKKNKDYSDDNYIFFGTSKEAAKTTITRYKNHYINLSGVKYITLHEFRHSHCSWLVNEVKNDKITIIAKRLGHSAYEALNTYSHIFESGQKELTDMMNQAIIDYPKKIKRIS